MSFRTRPPSIGQAAWWGPGRRSRRGHSRKSCPHCASEICIKKVQFRQCLGFDPNILNYATRREPHSKRYGKSRDRGQLIGVIAIEVGATVPVVDLERPHKTHSGFMRLCRHCPDSLLRRMGLVSGPKMLEQSLSPEDDRL